MAAAGDGEKEPVGAVSSMSVTLQPGLICPIDMTSPITLTVQEVPGSTFSRIDWQCTTNPAHNGTLLLDPTPPPLGLPATAASVLVDTNPPTRQFT